MTDKNDVVIRIVDDEDEVRMALRLMLEIEGWQTAVYDSAQSFLVNDKSSVPGCLLLDVRMPKMSGLELQQVMSERHIELPVIFLTGHADIDVAIASLKKGATDFLLKPVDDQKLIEAIENAVALDRKHRAGLQGQSQAAAGVALLSAREKEVLQLFLLGLNDRAVAERFSLSERTVQGHRARIYEKFRIHTAKDLALIADDIKAEMGLT